MWIRSNANLTRIFHSDRLSYLTLRVVRELCENNVKLVNYIAMKCYFIAHTLFNLIVIEK